jgi:ribosomal protein S18 acetylase RimI-like enzyme
MLQIRDARPDELDVTAEVMVAAYREYVPRDAPPPLQDYLDEIRDVRSRLADSTLILAEDDGRILGAVTYYADAGKEPHAAWPSGWANFRLLAVAPGARGKGAGRALTEECLVRARASGRTTMALHTTQMMQVARAMYERMGFVRVPEFDFSPVPGFLVMAYRLTL